MNKNKFPKYYVYEIWDPIESVCRYVGKGYGKRILDQSNPQRIKNERLKSLAREREKQGIKIEPKIVYRHNLEAEVLRKEMALIAKYGRIGVDKDGTLFNITSGGQGIVGRGKPIVVAGIMYSTLKEAADAYEVSEYSFRKRLSDGWTPDEAVGLNEHKTSSKNWKKVEVDGKVFSSQEEACRAFGVSSAVVIGRLKRGWTIKEAYGVKKRLPHQNRPITVDGKEFESVQSASVHFGVQSATALARLKRGWTPDEAFEIKRRLRKDKHHTESEVIDMRKRHDAGQSYEAIAKYYGVHASSVLMICQGRTYKNYGGTIATKKYINRRMPLSENDVLEIRKARVDGASLRSIMEKYNIDSSVVSNICTGKSYKTIGGPISKGQRRLTPSEVEEIQKEWHLGTSLQEIAVKQNVHLETIRRICKGLK